MPPPPTAATHAATPPMRMELDTPTPAPRRITPVQERRTPQSKPANPIVNFLRRARQSFDRGTLFS